MQPITSRVVVILLFVACVATGYGYQAPQGIRALRPVPPDSPVLSPQDEMKTFELPAGYRVELVASEPMVQDAVLIDWDPNGRMWVVEMPGYMEDIIASTEYQPSGRIVVLEDTNNDGAMDKRTVFADGLVLPRALKVLDRGALVAEPPNLWLMPDRNGDLKADGKELVTDQYGRRDANVEHNANGLTWALDNWMHTSEGDTYLRLKNGKFEVRATLSRGQWGNSQDDAGRIYRNSNSSVLHVDFVPTPYFLRNPNLTRTRGSYESLAATNPALNTTWPIRTNLVNRGYQTGVLREDGSLASYTGVNAPTVYRGNKLPAELHGNVFVAEPTGNLISRIVISDTGTTLRAEKPGGQTEFLASTDERFRPVYLSSAPDGALYFVDLYRGIIQHRGYITEYLRDNIVARKLEQPTRLGRIYRIMHASTQRDTRPALAQASPEQLVQTLAHPNGWWRDTAQRLLVERGATSVAPSLSALVAKAPDARTKLHALWTLDGMDAIRPEVVVTALKDPSRDVRAAAIRIAERFLGDNATVRSAVLDRMTDTDWTVRLQLAASVGLMQAAQRDAAAAELLGRYGDDQFVADATLSGLRGAERAVLEVLLRQPAETPARTAAVTLVAATIMRGADETNVQELLNWIAADTRAAWQRSALLRGAEAALLGASLTGAPAGGRGGGGGDAVW